MGRSGVVLVACALLLLSSCARVAAKSDEAEDASIAPMSCPIDPRNDGKFTGWPETTECAEWTVAPIDGTYGKLYLDYSADGTLRILNDWHLCTEKPPDNFYNLFQITTGGGAQQWMTRVMSNKVHVWLNGVKLGAFARGGAGFGPSPTLQTSHTIYEFALPDVKPGAIAMKLGDPGGPPFTSPEESIVMDPKGYGGVLQQGGGANLKAQAGPMVVALSPQKIEHAQQVTLQGYDFGATEGAVSVGGQSAKIVSWAAAEVVIAVGSLANGLHPVVLADAAGKSANVVMLQVQCTPKCGGKTCGDDGCGGSCGQCRAGTACQGGLCQCVPQCSGKECGDNGCGGSCGNCAVTEQCNFGKCACAPSCTGKQCGDDGCGGSCGGCKGTLAKCVSGACECTPDCAGKECGDNGCDGSCGGCDSGLTCQSGQCKAP